MNRNNIGPIIKYYRNRADLSQREFAALLSIAESTIRAYETNRALPDITTIDTIAKILKFDVNIFFSDFDPSSLFEPSAISKVTPTVNDYTQEEEKVIVKLRTISPSKRNAILTLLDIKA